jgi:glycosyltransferase involved in cell wall biosynthesis
MNHSLVAGEPAQAAAAPLTELDVTIIVPVQTVYAEVEQVVAGLGGELDRLGRTWECVLVFDGVRGGAWQKAQALVAHYGDKVKTISFENAFGESVCLSAGVERSRGKVIVTSPHYMQVDPVELGRMLAALDAGADFVTPWRKQRVDPWLNQIQSASFNWVIRRIIKGDFHDLNCYLRVFRRDVLFDISIYGDMYRFLPVIAQRQGFRVVEVPVRHLKEWGRAGFFGIGVYLRRFLDVLGVMFLTKFTLKPLRFFGSVGLLLSLVGGGMLSIMFVQHVFLGYQGLYGRNVFLLAIMLLVLGVQVLGFGLVGEIIIYTQARNLREYRIERIYE